MLKQTLKSENKLKEPFWKKVVRDLFVKNGTRKKGLSAGMGINRMGVPVEID